MPLIILILAIIVVFVCAHDRKKEHDRTTANYAHSRRKTNALKEQDVLDSFLRQGLTFDEAYNATQRQMCELGYDPCIPRNAYYAGSVDGCFHSDSHVESSCLFGFGNVATKYDSPAVKSRWEQIRSEGRIPTDEEIYAGFPKNDAEYIAQLKISTVKLQAVAIGDCFVFPKYGTVKVIAHDFLFGYYTVEVLSTGKQLRIKIGDRRIRRL